MKILAVIQVENELSTSFVAVFDIIVLNFILYREPSKQL